MISVEKVRCTDLLWYPIKSKSFITMFTMLFLRVTFHLSLQDSSYLEIICHNEDKCTENYLKQSFHIEPLHICHWLEQICCFKPLANFVPVCLFTYAVHTAAITSQQKLLPKQLQPGSAYISSSVIGAHIIFFLFYWYVVVKWDINSLEMHQIGNIEFSKYSWIHLKFNILSVRN